MGGVLGTRLVVLSGGIVVSELLKSHHVRRSVCPVPDVCGKCRNVWCVGPDSQERYCGFPEPESGLGHSGNDI